MSLSVNECRGKREPEWGGTLNTYSAWGLTLRLPFLCPALPVAHLGAVPDVEVVEGSVPRALASAVVRTGLYDAEPGRYLLRGGSRAGRFLIEDGKRITLERNPGAEDTVLAFHFVHSVIATLLHQRGHLVLHASAAVIDGNAAILSGESGAGKSTLLAALVTRGKQMLCDDVTAFRLNDAGEAEILPGAAQIHLCEDAAANIAPASACLPRHSWHRMKITLPAPGALAPHPVPLRRWILLRTWPGDRLRITPLSGASKLAALHDCILGPLFAEEHEDRFPMSGAMLDRVSALSVERPAGEWSVDRLAEVLVDGELSGYG